MPNRNEGTGLAGGLIVTALLDRLLVNNVLPKSEIRDILKKSLAAIGPDSKTPEGYAASKIIQDLLGGKFSERS
jgi:hypothetical protein